MEKSHCYVYMIFIGSLVGISHCNEPLTIPARLNNLVTIPCRLSGEDCKDANVRWFNEKDGYLTSGTRVYKHNGKIKINKPSPCEWNLRILRMSRSFEDTYTCKTDVGAIISTVKLIIETPPKVDETESSPIRVAFTEHSNATLRCVVTGIPEPEITWYRGKQQQGINYPIGDWYPEKIVGITGPELKIREITRYAADEYICRAINKIDEAERIIRVTVNFDPEVTVMESEVYAAKGELVTMSCVIQASPLYDAYWTNGTDLNGEAITSSWKFKVLEEEGWDGMPVKFLTLVIRKAMLANENYGKYTCVAKGKTVLAGDTVELKEPKAVTTDEEGKVINYKDNKRKLVV